MNFGEALDLLKQGERVCREGWNGKGMSIVLVDKGYFDVGISIVGDNHRKLLPWIGMRTTDSDFVPWLASQTDMLAEDWQIAD